MENINQIKVEVARRADISRRYLDYLLTGEKNARPDVATRLERTTHIHKSIWTFGSSGQRQSLFNNFVETFAQTWFKN